MTLFTQLIMAILGLQFTNFENGIKHLPRVKFHTLGFFSQYRSHMHLFKKKKKLD